jgi:hypothetical protein
MTEIRKSKQYLVMQGLGHAQVLAPRVEYWNLRFICNLVLGIYDFRHKISRQSHLSLTPARRDRLGSLSYNFYSCLYASRTLH